MVSIDNISFSYVISSLRVSSSSEDSMAKNTLYNKVWDAHSVATLPTGQTQLFIGLHLIHEVTSPQAFDMLRERGLQVAYPSRTFATMDHIVPTKSQARPFADKEAE